MAIARCGWCGGREQYADLLDAYYCVTCDRWSEPACLDPSCLMCWGRPERPSEWLRSAGPEAAAGVSG